ncbi:kynurenine 3-monooxygenase, mitochondrial precursor [Tilletia horrida]|uniref:Kynurenine 3-monooxygenase, mitochondrial n=1 Tax=Tilletia horrida TaxID=155126 RepID=A0AAN6JSZ3_9BASI|nr:kynurenine 3-monooxygenase, mitochondrial precursor [Tilletia horrida]KAK0568110.1 kynurenine 3-monooxygenase, mitochondrial precursor [Tilletia horrida]
MERVAIVGAGPVGSLAAIALAERGCQVDLYEQRPDEGTHAAAAATGNTRSINLAISTRALTALHALTPASASASEEPSLADVVLANGIPMHARMIHTMPAASSPPKTHQQQQQGAGARLEESIPEYDSLAPERSSSAPSPPTAEHITLHSQDYGIDPDTHRIYSVDRSKLSNLLLTRASAHPRVQIYRGYTLQDLHFSNNDKKTDQGGVSLSFRPTTSITSKTAEENLHLISASADLVIGCDGMHSSVRKALDTFQPLGIEQAYIDCAYIELHISPPPTHSDGSAPPRWPLSPQHLHIWPRHSFMLIALPNADRSFTCTLFAPYALFGAQRPPSSQSAGSEHPLAGSLSTPDAAIPFFKTYFPDALTLMGEEHVREAIRTRAARPGRLGSVQLHNGLYHERVGGRAVLLGDAAHAMVPFYGQGLNCGLEDVHVLIQALEAEGVLPALLPKADDRPSQQVAIKHKDQRTRLVRALDLYSCTRHPALCAIQQLAQQNYEEMSHRVVSKTYLARKWLDGVLMRLMAPSSSSSSKPAELAAPRSLRDLPQLVIRSWIPELGKLFLPAQQKPKSTQDEPLSFVVADKPAFSLQPIQKRSRSASGKAIINRLVAPTEQSLGAWKSLYTMVTFTNMPYDAVLRQAARQDRIMNAVGLGVGGLIGLGAWSVWTSLAMMGRA